MKKIILLTVLLTAASVLFSSCVLTGGSEKKCSEIMSGFFEVVPKREGDALYVYGSERTGKGYIGAMRLEELYRPDGGGDPGELEAVKDYCIFIAASAPDEKICEIHILRARTRSERKTVEEMVSRRAKALSKPDIGSSFGGAECLVFCRNDLVFLFVTDKNSELADMARGA